MRDQKSKVLHDVVCSCGESRVVGLYHCPACYVAYPTWGPPVPEWAIQVDFVRFARAKHTGLVITHNMNNQTNSAAGNRAKTMGVLAGMPDLTIYATGGRVLLLELKRKTGRKTGKQPEVHNQLSELGFRVETPTSLAEAMQITDAWIMAGNDYICKKTIQR